MKKNILFAVMVVLLVLVGFGSFLAGKNHTYGMETGETNSESYIGYPEYVSIYMLKDLLPYAVYKECVLPHAQKLFVLDTITKKDFLKFQQDVNKSLQKKGYSVRQLVRDYVCEESFSDSFQRNIDKFNDDARKMGKGMKDGIENFMKRLTEESPKKKPNKTKTPPSTEL